MATVANLVVSVTAKSSGLDSELSKSANKIKNFAASSVKSLAVIGAAVTAGTVAALVGIKSAIDSTTSEIDRIAKVAGRIGIAVSELQALQFAAQLSGLEVEGFNNVLKFMLKNLGDAANGTGEAKASFEQLGLSVSKLSKQNASDQFLEISAAIAKVSDKSQQFAIASKIFGKSGTEALTLINDDVGKLVAQYTKLDIALNQTQAKSVEALDDINGTFAQLGIGFKQQVTANIAPALTNVIKYILELVDKAGGIREVAKNASIALLNFGINGVEAVSSVISGFKEFGIIIDKIQLGIATLAVSAARFKNIFGEIKGPADLIRASFTAPGKALGLFNPSEKDQQMARDTLSPQVQKLVDGNQSLMEYEKSAQEKVLALKTILEKQVEALNNGYANGNKAAAGAGKAAIEYGPLSYTNQVPQKTQEVKVTVDVKKDAFFDVIDARVDQKLSDAARSLK